MPVKKNMQFEYTGHAEENIRERNLGKNLIEETMICPDKVIETRFGRKIAQKIIDKKLLRVIYKQEENVYIIVTAYFSKPERYR